MNQHMVSRVLLRRFAGRRRSEVGVLDLRSATASPGKIAEVGVLTDFVVKGADTTEEKWRKVEQALPYAFTLIEQRRILDNQKFVTVIKDCIALHFARSFALTEMYKRERHAKRQQVADDVLSEVPATHVIRALTGIEVPPSGANYIARDLIARKFDTNIEDHALPAQILLQNYERGRQHAANADLEFWYAPECELILGDVPAAAYERATNKVGALNGVKWGENADALFMPLGPHHAVALSKQADYLDADARTVECMNVIQIQGAYREIYFRPGSGIDEVIINALSGGSGSTSTLS
jgi:hypothetical protein